MTSPTSQPLSKEESLLVDRPGCQPFSCTIMHISKKHVLQRSHRELSWVTASVESPGSQPSMAPRHPGQLQV